MRTRGRSSSGLRALRNSLIAVAVVAGVPLLASLLRKSKIFGGMTELIAALAVGVSVAAWQLSLLYRLYVRKGPIGLGAFVLLGFVVLAICMLLLFLIAGGIERALGR